MSQQTRLESLKVAIDAGQPGYANLLTPDGYSPKTDKGHARNVATAILYLAPADASGVANLCTYASDGCRASCLYKAGRGGFDPDVPAARIARTVQLKLDRAAFNARLVKETAAHERKAGRKAMQCAMRPNGTSDLPWEHYKVNAAGDTLMSLFPNVQFYDYTKNPKRALSHARGEMPANYHLTFSRSETNEDDCRAVLAAGANVAVVFNICDCKRPCKHEIPDGVYTYMGRPVVSGDHDDLRFLDPAGVVVGLKAKGPAKTDTSGFVVDIAQCRRVSECACGALGWYEHHEHSPHCRRLARAA